MSLIPGQNVSLTNLVPTLTAVSVVFGWEAPPDFELDASAIALGSNKLVLSDAHFVFFNNLRSPDGCVEHAGSAVPPDDSRAREIINVDLARISAEVDAVIFAVTIYDGAAQNQPFARVRNARIAVVDRSTSDEVAVFEVKSATSETTMVFGELYRRGTEWKFRAVGQGYASGLAGLASDYGVDV